MAEVLPPLQSTGTITMLHSRPSSADAFQSSSQHQSPQQQQSQHHTRHHSSHTPRAVYNAHNNTSYRSTAGPVQPYAFQSTPHLRQETRTLSAPPSSSSSASHKQGHNSSPSVSSSNTSSVPSAKDDSIIGSRPGSLINLPATQLPDLNFTPFDPPLKPSPDRYRRSTQKKSDVGNPTQLPPVNPSSHVHRHGSVDDMAVKSSTSEAAKRYRRRSLNSLETQAIMVPPPGQNTATHNTNAPALLTTRPVSFHSNSGNSDDTETPSRNGTATPPPQADASGRISSRTANETLRSSQSNTKSIAIPPRGSSDANKRTLAPSPLSRQATDADSQSSPVKTKTYAAAAQSAVVTPSPAAQQLAAVSDKDLNKGMKSRLRRAFSFGSAQELRKAAGENTVAAQQAREQHQQRLDDELDAEQQEIARRQEEAGIGAGIYSGQGGFSGSTDNLSISSTASSASMMLRKMGRGAKKSARSIKGLFRPKSVVGVPAADGPVQVQSGAIVQPSVGQVSMVTVEAERNKVNVHPDLTEKPGGGTGFPKLERNSIDAAAAAAAATATPAAAEPAGTFSRRSIVGSDRDRAEVLAAVKKGILKRNGTSSPNASPDIRPSDPPQIGVPQPTGSPTSSRPSTPKIGRPQGRSASMNGDYFSPRAGSVTKSMPNTPNGSVRTITFSPRIQFHDAWSSSDYDRRGDIATCNRLTPMLAQQIKEELNTFKMEMEVHELSKPHTHFF